MATPTTVVTLVLVGPYAEKDIVLFGIEFKDGIAELVNPKPSLLAMFARCYNAHPEGSEALIAAEAAWDRLQVAEATKARPETHTPKADKPLADMRATELIEYAKDNNLDIGEMIPQNGQRVILAAVLEAIAKKSKQNEDNEQDQK